MQFTKNQLIIIGGVILLVVVVVLMGLGILPGLKKSTGTNSAGITKIQTSLSFWTFGEPDGAFNASISAFHAANPTAEVKVRSFKTFDEYNRTLIDALAAGVGPDILTIRNTDLPVMMNKLTPAPQTALSLQGMRTAFPQVVEQDFIQNGSTYALPLSIDTLAIFYNRDFLDAEGVNPPATWNDLLDIAPKLSKPVQSLRAGATELSRGGVAIGSSKTIPEAPNILSLLLMQSGVQMTSPDFKSATFASKDAGKTALTFYTQFANPRSKSYTWNDGVGNSYDAFAQEKVAMIFGYANSLSEIKKRNAFLNFAIAPTPQPKDAEKPISYPNYVGYGVSRQTKNAALSWQFVTSFAAEANARAYLTVTKRPPALRSLISEYRSDPSLGVFAAQALTAKSWAQINADSIHSIFSQAIDSVVSSAVLPETAIRAAQDQITALMLR